MTRVPREACANTRCEHHPALQTSSIALTPYEVNFAYSESDTNGSNSPSVISKNALVKIVLCPRCARKLKYKGEQDKRERTESKRSHSHRA